MKKSDGLAFPEKQGLYDPDNEHDACGMGFVVNVKGIQSHSIILQGLEVLENIEHRGACGCEPNTGDGAGILTQVPDRFFRSICEFDLPEKGKYGVGVIFMPRDEAQREICFAVFEKVVSDEGQKLLGWRAVPVDNSDLGDTALLAEPQMYQVFVEGFTIIEEDPLGFERILYLIRKRVEKEIRDKLGESGFYVASFSSRTLV